MKQYVKTVREVQVNNEVQSNRRYYNVRLRESIEMAFANAKVPGVPNATLYKGCTLDERKTLFVGV